MYNVEKSSTSTFMGKMAFEHPLEADSVDYKNGFFSSFVQAPLLGPLVWILGGTIDKDNSRGESTTVLDAKENKSDQTSIALKSSVETFTSENYRNKTEIIRADHFYSADEICSTDADSSDESYSDDSTKVNHNFAENMKQRHQVLKNKTKMSWSDESGQSLVEYCDELQPSGQVLQATNTSQKSIMKPIKSAIRKSRKGLSSLPCHTSHCVPSGLSGGSIIMPSGGGIIKTGNIAINGGNGYISPQWGWYISTTPPSPEKYYSNVAKGNVENLQRQPILDRQPTKPAIVPTFRRVTNIAPNCAQLWPSVPL